MSTQGTLSRVQPAGGEPGYGAGTQALGSSDDALHGASFPGSPIIGDPATLNDSYIKSEFQAVLDGVQTANVDFGPGGVDMDYGAAPKLAQSKSIQDLGGLKSGNSGGARGDGQGMPAGPFVPTTASPNDGTTNATALPGVPPVKGKDGENGKIHNPHGTRYSYDLDTAYVKGESGIPGIK